MEKTLSLHWKLLRSYEQRMKTTELWESLVFPVFYGTSLLRARAYSEAINQVRAYCLFVGHGRSGHSVLGAMLDAHPEAVIPDELDTLRFIQAGFKKSQICTMLLNRSAKQARRGRIKTGRDGRYYSYKVPDQWQGRFQRLSVIGDSQAGLSTRRLGEHPELITTLEQVMKVPVHVIHVIRNPFDNISTLMLRGNWSFDYAIDRYFSNCDTIAHLRTQVPDSRFLVVKQEELLARPKVEVARACSFLDLHPSASYLKSCCSILYKSPAHSRTQIAWTPPLVARVQHAIDRFEFLQGYSFDS